MFRGLSAFPITPTDADGRVRPDDLARLLRRLEEAGVASVGLLGSTGAYAYLDRAQRRAAVEVAADVLGGRVPLVAGVGALRTDAAETFARDAAEAGADGLLLAPVSYTPLSDEEVFRHFAAVAEAGGLPLCVYDNPGTTHFTFSEALLARLASVQAIAAVKTPAPAAEVAAARHATLRAALPADFAIGYSVDWNAAAAVAEGGEAWYSVIGGLLPRQALALYKAASAGERDRLTGVEAAFQPLWSLFCELSSLRVVYAGARVLGLTDAEPPRPILPLSTADHRRVEAALKPLDALASIA